ncbi:uncharacterized protein EI97DRAFT_481287 [Westerdykella ornata]|uniref:Uncharacterized protein n=1 Tax=Westerdykella ornata TaxID=318751 RepID=A0A6A6JSD6_WESOR|nr:uncharacterized protein EI97DRAFT_481287 [Westerdykella ornata]KAF2279174.1 hypothetical protein EI97DRAFT_481287 [Westerdykella ornata]
MPDYSLQLLAWQHQSNSVAGAVANVTSVVSTTIRSSPQFPFRSGFLEPANDSARRRVSHRSCEGPRAPAPAVHPNATLRSLMASHVMEISDDTLGAAAGFDGQMSDSGSFNDSLDRHGSSSMPTSLRGSASPHDHKVLVPYDSDSDSDSDSASHPGDFVDDRTRSIHNSGIETASLPEEAESPLFEPESGSHGATFDGTNETRPATTMVRETSTQGSSTKSTRQEVIASRGTRAAKAMPQAKMHPLAIRARAGRRGKSVERDPENHMIKDLRINGSYTWTAIANILNERRIAEGMPPTCTAASVYGRFVRNAPRIAQSLEGDYNFNPSDYMHLRRPQNYPAPGPDLLDTSKKRTRAEANGKYQTPRDIKGNVRQVTSDGQDLQSPEKAAKFVKAVEMATQEFWRNVRDAMEQLTGHVYDPKVLEDHYETI